MGDPKIYTAEEAEALRAAATPGPWHVPDRHPDAALIAAAPDLAASVVHHARRADAAEAEVERLKVDAAGVAYFQCWPDGFLEAMGAASANTVDDVVARLHELLAAEAEVRRLRDLVKSAYLDGWDTGQCRAGYGNPLRDWNNSTACTALGEPR